MKLLNLFAFCSATIAIHAVAITYECTLTHELTPNEGETTTLTTQKGKFDSTKDLFMDMAVPKPDGRAVASLYLNREQTKLSLMMGDYCGEHYLDIEIPVRLGEPIHSIYSYGRNPENNNDWRRLLLDCTMEK